MLSLRKPALAWILLVLAISHTNLVCAQEGEPSRTFAASYAAGGASEEPTPTPWSQSAPSDLESAELTPTPTPTPLALPSSPSPPPIYGTPSPTPSPDPQRTAPPPPPESPPPFPQPAPRHPPPPIPPPPLISEPPPAPSQPPSPTTPAEPPPAPTRPSLPMPPMPPREIPTPAPLKPPSESVGFWSGANILFLVVLIGSVFGILLGGVLFCGCIYRRWYLKRARYQSMKNASLQLSTVFQMDDHSDGEDEMMTLGLDGNRRRTLDNDL
mmetsp:Transcript_7911/g.22654  ORF Transcript_7911/g.22654 Transcript_7911/m.22654 type:complete len:269 (-) Transcript_7911:2101-2907(-)